MTPVRRPVASGGSPMPNAGAASENSSLPSPSRLRPAAKREAKRPGRMSREAIAASN